MASMEEDGLMHMLQQTIRNVDDTPSGKSCVSAMLNWQRYILGWRCKNNTLRNGENFEKLVIKCGFPDFQLPFPNTRNKAECISNLQRVASYVGVDTSLATEIHDGSEKSAALLIAQIVFRLRLSDIKDEVHNRTGAPQLDYWCREVVGMDRTVHGTTDVDHPANLEKLLSFLNIDIPHSQYGALSSAETKCLFLLKLVRRETGIPILTEKIQEGNKSWKIFLGYTWLAELYVLYVKRTRTSPGEVIESIVKGCMEESAMLDKLEENSLVFVKRTSFSSGSSELSEMTEQRRAILSRLSLFLLSRKN